MTDKQIIIDVCPYQGECSVSGCKRNDDGCFVRQLFEERYKAENQIVELNKKVEAKEQECEMLKEILKDKTDEYNKLTVNYDAYVSMANKQLDQLKAKEQECEYLKKKLFRKEAVVEFASCPSYGYSDNTIEATCTKTFCYDVNSCEHKTMVKYELTLAEIKEIAQKFYHQELGNRDCMNCDDYCFDKILQKISECEVEDEHNRLL